MLLLEPPTTPMPADDLTLKLTKPAAAAAPRALDASVTLSLVIPCYNEEDVLPLLFERLRTVMAVIGLPYEVVLIDDGSKDATWDLMVEANRLDPRWKGVRLARNFGHQAALWAGLNHCTGTLVAVLDADLQDPPEVLPQFFAKWAEGFDVVYAVRTKRKEGPLKKLAYYAYYRLLASLAEIDIPLDAGDFCVMDRKVLDAMLATHETGPYVRGLRAWVGFKQVGLPYERSARAAGEVKYTFRKLMQLALNGILSFSVRPLRIATYMGFLVSGVAFLGALFTLFQGLFPEAFAAIGLKPVPGFATTVVSVLFLGGVQLICLGIVGEYVGRIYETVKGRPTPTVREVLGANPER